MKINDSAVPYSLISMPVFIWIGFVCSISFMEAWLKFQAPNVSLSIGLGIGNLVFAALNKVEWCLAGIIIGLIFYKKIPLQNAWLLFFYIPLLILFVQTLYLLPSLYERAEILSRGETVSRSFVHLYYVCLEVVKVVSLLVFGLKIIL